MKRQKLGDRLRSLFSRTKYDEAFFEDLGDVLIEGDVGARIAMDIVDELEERARADKISDKQTLVAELKTILSGYLKTVDLTIDPQKLGVFLFLGVNGVGKTTTIAKTAEYYRRKEGIDSIVFAAGDTFRAAAGEQLSILGERTGIRVVKQQPGSDPGSVIYDGIESISSRGGGLVLADTAGRMHTKNNLVRELGKIDKIITGKIGSGYYRKLLVIDATTGQNALRQAEIFHEAVGVDAVIMAKFDSTAKGGIAVSICKELGIPFAFAGTGEKLDRLRRFESGWFLNEFLGVS